MRIPRIDVKSPRAALTSACLLVSSMCTPALTQITPERTYYGANRPMPFVVEVPEGGQAASVKLLHDDGSELASADVAAGRVDLAALFPRLWGGEHQHVHYAQLVVDDKGVGSPVVLQPLLTPQYAYPVDRASGQPQVPPGRGAVPMYAPMGQVVFSGMRAWADKHVVLTTSMGEIEFRMRPDQAPNTCWNFMSLAEGGFYTDIIFHRIVAQTGNGMPFVIQVGDPTGTGAGGPGYFIDLEPTSLPHDFGVLSMARSSEPNSNGSQIFVCLSRGGTSFLDGNYTAFAEALNGADVIRKIAAVPVGAQDRPNDPPVLQSARVVPAPPFGTAPKPLSVQEAEANSDG